MYIAVVARSSLPRFRECGLSELRSIRSKPAFQEDGHGYDDIVDVIIPVHNNFEDARRLFDSLIGAVNEVRCRLVVVDDASADTAAAIVPRATGSVAEVLFHRYEKNVGFAASVNTGLRLGRRDVVVLNTDTLVFDNWLDRLRKVSASQPNVATITPMSNAATILSYPTFPDEFKSELEIGWDAIDRMCDCLDAMPVPIPTGVGFCMLITRRCIDAVGLFNEDVFGAGYGEECDFCRRAAAQGWTNLAAPNVFVWHRGEGSFGGRAATLRAEAQRVLEVCHPGYSARVAAFISEDPLLSVRRALDLRRVTSDPRPCHLHLEVGRSACVASEQKNICFRRHKRVVPSYQPSVDGFTNLANLPIFTPFTPIRHLQSFIMTVGIEKLIVYTRQGSAAFLFRRFERAAHALGVPIEYA